MTKATSKKKGETDAPVPAFEAALARLEQIVELLDDGNLPLDESLALFKEGTKLAKACREQLAHAEVQVKEALRDVESPDEEEEEEGDDRSERAADDDEGDDDEM